MKAIPLTQGLVALVDDEDFEELSKFKWYANKVRYVYYAKRNGKRDSEGRRKAILMHHEILKVDSSVDIDHRDGNGLNNTKQNLRVSVDGGNMRNARRRRDNTTGFKGVHFTLKNRKFKATIAIKGKDKHLGYFNSAEAAHAAYCIAAVKYHGEFARFE